jgi:hypothetical protein
MAAEPQTKFARAARESRPRKHGDSLPRRKLSAGINAALLALYPSPIARQTLLNLFENRATFASITAWRFGWVIPPPWATELVKKKLRSRIANLERLTEMPSRGPGPGERGAAHWRHWRAKQAEEREAKKKAAELAALHDPKREID